MNPDLPPVLNPPNASQKPLTLQPGFLLALRGVWLFTWKSQCNWRLPIRMLGLLILPFLVYITITSPQEWANRHSLLGNPFTQVNDFSRRLDRAKFQLQPGQRSQLQQIFQEEFARAESARRTTRQLQADADERINQIQECYERIRSRVQTVLDDNQFAQYQNFEKRNIQFGLARTGEPMWNWSAPFYHWLIDLYFFIVLPLSCVRGSGGLIRDELQADTLGFLTTRPLSRARLVIVKYLSQTVWLQILLLVETLLLFAAGSLRHIPELGPLLSQFLAAQFLAVFAWCALGLFLGQITNRYIALALIYGAIVELGIGRIPTNINTLSLMRHLKTLLAHNPALQTIYEWSGKGVPFSTTTLVLATGIFLSLAALMFTFREYHHTAEMQK